jgi:hypothetical protein
MLFVAEDDSVTNPALIAKFAEELKKSNPNTTHVTTPSGDHYDSMIKVGIPKGVEWLKSIDQPKAK